MVQEIGLQVYPVLGNHDIDPKSQFPGSQTQDNFDYYKEVADVWQPWLGQEAYGQFTKGGYYSIKPDTLPFRLIGLNTNVYYKSDKLTADMEDPLDQLKWLEQELDKARQGQEKVIIFAHVTPGMFERYYRTNQDGFSGYYWFRPTFNEKFLQMVEQNSDVILGQVIQFLSIKDSFV